MTFYVPVRLVMASVAMIAEISEIFLIIVICSIFVSSSTVS